MGNQTAPEDKASQLKEIKAVSDYIEHLKTLNPHITEDVVENYESSDALEEPGAGVLYVCKVLKQELERGAFPAAADPHDPDQIHRLQSIKNALRTAEQIAAHLKRSRPEEFESFEYTQPPKSEAQLLWSMLNFASLELEKDLIEIESPAGL
jgi:hypothetical protein